MGALNNVARSCYQRDAVNIRVPHQSRRTSSRSHCTANTEPGQNRVGSDTIRPLLLLNLCGVRSVCRVCAVVRVLWIAQQQNPTFTRPSV